MKRSLVGALALAGTLAACSDSTSPGGSGPPAPGTYVTCNANAPLPSDLFPGGGPPSPTGPRAILWFLDAAVRRGPVDLCIDSWRGYTDWPKLSAGGGLFMKSSAVPHTLVATAAGDSMVLASTEITIAVNTQYTVVFTPRSDLLVLYDTVSAPPSGMVSFRFVNVAPDGGAVDMYVTTGSGDLTGQAPVVSNLAPDAVSPYMSFPVVPSRLIITAAGDPNAVLHEGWFGESAAEAGTAWTILFGEMYIDDSPRLTTDWRKDRG